MKEQFATYKIALKLRELGFDEACFGWYNKEATFIFPANNTLHTSNSRITNTDLTAAPLWQQVEQWLFEKYKILIKNQTNCDYTNIIYCVNHSMYSGMRQTNLIHYTKEKAILEALKLITKT